MMRALMSFLNFGFDSFLAGVAIGVCAQPWRARFRLAAAFGACDAAATLLGSQWPHSAGGALTLAICLLCMFLFTPATQTRRALLCVLPVGCSIDNLFSGVPASMAPVLGASSAVMALLGLSLAAFGRCNLRGPEAQM